MSENTSPKKSAVHPSQNTSTSPDSSVRTPRTPRTPRIPRIPRPVSWPPGLDPSAASQTPLPPPPPQLASLMQPSSLNSSLPLSSQSIHSGSGGSTHRPRLVQSHRKDPLTTPASHPASMEQPQTYHTRVDPVASSSSPWGQRPSPRTIEKKANIDVVRQDLSAAIATRSPSTYNNLFVIAVRFENDDTEAKKDADKLTRALEHYCGNVRRFEIVIPKRGIIPPSIQLARRIRKAIEAFYEGNEFKSLNSIIILYYTGHGFLGEGECLQLGQRYGDYFVDFNSISEILVNPQEPEKTAIGSCDLIFLIDCCHSGAAAKFRSGDKHRLATVISAAASYERTPGGATNQSFTAEFVTELIRLAKTSGARSIDLGAVTNSMKTTSTIGTYNIFGFGTFVLPLSNSVAVPAERSSGFKIPVSANPSRLLTEVDVFPALNQSTPVTPGSTAIVDPVLNPGVEERLGVLLQIDFEGDPTHGSIKDLTNFLMDLSPIFLARVVDVFYTNSTVMLVVVDATIYDRLPPIIGVKKLANVKDGFGQRSWAKQIGHTVGSGGGGGMPRHLNKGSSLMKKSDPSV